MRSFWLSCGMAILLGLFGMQAAASERQRIEREDQLPRFTYRIPYPLESVVRDARRFAEVSRPIRADIESLLNRYDIADRSLQRRLLTVLAQLDFLAGRYDDALARTEAIRELEDKPADKLVSGFALRAMARAARETGGPRSPGYRSELARELRDRLDVLPYDVAGNEVKELKAILEQSGRGMVIGTIRDQMQPMLDRSGFLGPEVARRLVSQRFFLEATLASKPVLVAAYKAYLDERRVAKADIWEARASTLPAQGAFEEVRIAIWDTGVDSRVYGKRMVRDAQGRPAVIGFDLHGRRNAGDLRPVPDAVRPQLPRMLALIKGFSDIDANIDSPDAAKARQVMSELQPEAYRPTMEALGFTGSYIHGTHVAGIAIAGNPWARLVNARTASDHKMQPNPCPSDELARGQAAEFAQFVGFLKQHGVRVANMSWGTFPRYVESQMEKCGVGRSPEDRRVIARRHFQWIKEAMHKAIASAPNILFVAAAGNLNSSSTFNEVIPASLDLPNLITVGAVDRAGDEVGFTSYGPTVRVHANGYEVPSYLPGGQKVELSGTSMAAPQVANLAGQLLAIKPSLTPPEIIKLIEENADTSADGRRRLIHPARTVARVRG